MSEENQHVVHVKLDELIQRADLFIKQFEHGVHEDSPPALYELVYTMNAVLKVFQEFVPEAADHERFVRAVLDETMDRLSDAMMENIEMTVRLRSAEDEVVQANEKAASQFVSEKLAEIFAKPSKGNSK